MTHLREDIYWSASITRRVGWNNRKERGGPFLGDRQVKLSTIIV